MKLPDLEAAQQALGLRFKDPSVLLEALVHRSYNNEFPEASLPDNERLEFLGDAALGLVVARGSMARTPTSRGKLTEMRAALVRRETLARAAIRFDLGEYLLSGGARRPAAAANVTDLARAFEAVMGAILLDRGLARGQLHSSRAQARSRLAGHSAGDHRPQVTPAADGPGRAGSGRHPTR